MDCDSRTNKNGIGIWLVVLGISALLSGPADAKPKAAVKESRDTLSAAAGKVDITPDLKNETTWLAGYGSHGRRAEGVHDPLYARAILISDGKKTVALVSVDSIGIYRGDVLAIRKTLGWDGGNSYLFLASTHDHSAPDTLGLWGRFIGVSGLNEQYHRRLLQSVVNLVQGLSDKMRPVEIDAASAMVNPNDLCRDSRDPVVIDPELQVLRLQPKHWLDSDLTGKYPEAIATLVRWSCHAEVMGSENKSVTADFPGPLCQKIESKGGGTCVFFNGTIGGLMTPEVDRSGGVQQEFSEAKRVGEQVADYARLALQSASDHYGSGSINFASKIVRVPVENSRYLLFLPSLTFGHTITDSQGNALSGWKTWWLPLRHLLFFPLPDNLRPWVETEVSLVKIGPIEILGIPGEMFPELAIGGYDGRYRFGHPLIGPKNQNPPDLSKAPKGPYLRQKVRSEHALLIGLANDELGYILPGYDFVATPSRSMLPKPKGHHYEETNSIGPSVTDILLKAFDDLLAQ